MMGNRVPMSNKTPSDGIDGNYVLDLEKDPKYSLEIDPENKYNMSITQKEFIKNYIEFGNIPLAAELCDIDKETAKGYYNNYASQQEIRRISMAMYQRRFATKMLSLEQIGGYLSSQLTDENVPMKDRLSSKDKLTVAKMIIDIHRIKEESVNNPGLIDAIDVEAQLKDLSVESIQTLIETSNNKEKIKDKKESKEEIIEAIDTLQKEQTNVGLSPEEKSYMNSLDVEELLGLLEVANGKVNK